MREVDSCDDVFRKELNPSCVDGGGLLQLACYQMVVPRFHLESAGQSHSISQIETFLFSRCWCGTTQEFLCGSQSRIGQSKIWVYLNGALVKGYRHVQVSHDVMPVTLCQELQCFQR